MLIVCWRWINAPSYLPIKSHSSAWSFSATLDNCRESPWSMLGNMSVFLTCWPYLACGFILRSLGGAAEAVEGNGWRSSGREVNLPYVEKSNEIAEKWGWVCVCVHARTRECVCVTSHNTFFYLFLDVLLICLCDTFPNTACVCVCVSWLEVSQHSDIRPVVAV